MRSSRPLPDSVNFNYAMNDKLKMNEVRHGEDWKAKKPAGQALAREVKELIIPELKRAKSEKQLQVPSLD